jgi:hypothetical protein
MHGYAGPVERKIRLWVVQQERNRRKQGQLSPHEPIGGETPARRARRAVDLGGRA